MLVIIINFRTAEMTLDCVRSLLRSTDEVPQLHVLLVENGSGDGSADRLAATIAAERWDGRVTLIALPENRGFSGGNNVGLQWHREHRPDLEHVLLLNSDTIVYPGVLRHCLSVIAHEPGIGILGCKLLNRDGSNQTSTRPFPTPLRQMICSLGLPWLMRSSFAWADIYDIPDALNDQKRDCDWLIGAFMLIPKKVLDRVGFLDERFFFYGEDVEFCHRMWSRGYRVHYDPAVAITHLGGGSSDPTRVASRAKAARMWRARYQIQRICYGRLAEFLVRLTDLLSYSLRGCKLLLLGRRKTEAYRSVAETLSILTSRPETV